MTSGVPPPNTLPSANTTEVTRRVKAMTRNEVIVRAIAGELTWLIEDVFGELLRSSVVIHPVGAL